MTDARERRRERAEENKEGFNAGSALKKIRVPLIIVLLWGAGMAIAVATSDAGQECPGHWHSTLSLHVDGQRVVFTQNPAYTLEGGIMPISTHMHRGSEGIWHFEPTKKGCIDYKDALARVDMQMTTDKLELKGDYHAQAGWGGTHTTNETNELNAWIKEWEGSWEPIALNKLANMQVPDGAQVLVVYGNETDEAIAGFQEGATPVSQPPGPSDAGGLPIGPLFGLSAFALVGLLVWRSFTKGVS